MLKALTDFFDRAFAPEVVSPEERTILAEIKNFFRLNDEAARMLVREAKREADRAVSLQAFTRRLVEQLSEAERHSVVEMLWRVALADRRLDKREDYLVRQVAELLYVSQSDLIRIRNRVYEPQL